MLGEAGITSGVTPAARSALAATGPTAPTTMSVLRLATSVSAIPDVGTDVVEASPPGAQHVSHRDVALAVVHEQDAAPFEIDPGQPLQQLARRVRFHRGDRDGHLVARQDGERLGAPAGHGDRPERRQHVRKASAPIGLSEECRRADAGLKDRHRISAARETFNKCVHVVEPRHFPDRGGADRETPEPLDQRRDIGPQTAFEQRDSLTVERPAGHAADDSGIRHLIYNVARLGHQTRRTSLVEDMK